MKTFQGAKTKIFTVTNKRSPSPHWSFLLPKPEKKVFAFKSARALFVGQWFSTCQPEVESRTQGSRPRPKTQKKSEAKVKDSLSEDRHSRGQGQECSRPRPRTLEQVLSKKKKSSQKFFRRSQKKKRERSSHKFFKRSPQKNVFQKIFQALHKIFNNSKNSAVLESRTSQFSRT